MASFRNPDSVRTDPQRADPLRDVIDRPRDSALDPHTRRASSGRALLVELYDAAVAGAAPGPLTARALREIEIPADRRVWMLAMGKAAHPMASAAIASLHESSHTIAGGAIVAPELHPSPDATINSFVGDHPLPGRNSFAAAQRIGELAGGVRGGDVAVVLISGGATSLIGAPLRGMPDADLVHLYELLLGSGLDIREMNAVRKRFTRWGGGRLALALAPARTHALIISDVAGDDPADIASGPCAPDPNTVHDVLDILHRVRSVRPPRAVDARASHRSRARSDPRDAAQHASGVRCSLARA